MADRLNGASRWQKFLTFVINYLEQSSFHGAWHLTRIRRNHSIETTLWGFTIVTLVILSCYNASLFWRRYLFNPTVITIDRDYLNRNITFPPITLCLRNKLNESAMEEFLIEKGFNDTQRKDVDLRKFLWNLSHFNINNLHDLITAKGNYFNVDDYFQIMMKISNKISNNISLSSTYEASYFKTILTDELENLETHSVTKSLEEINYLDGDATAVVANLMNNVDIYYHGPNELPSTLRRITNEDPDQNGYMSLTVMPVIIMARENIRNLFEFQRNCKFIEESVLTYFPQVYTHDLCRLECRMKKFLQLCKCLPFFYKRNNDDRRCNKQGLKCIFRNRAIIDTLRAADDCGCVKDCNDIKYSLQTSDTLFWFHNSKVSWTMMQTKVIFKRELIYGLIEALISTGANLSLFVGISCLTLVEILFFFYLLMLRKL